jgi:preprotein translocase subunit YajC
VTPLLAVFTAAEQQQGSLLSLLFPLLLLAPVIYLMIVPQRKQKQRHAEFISSLKVGDDVVTSGGIHGVVTHLDNDIVHVEVDTDVVIRVSKASLARREGPASTSEAGDESDEPDSDTTPTPRSTYPSPLVRPARR